MKVRAAYGAYKRRAGAETPVNTVPVSIAGTVMPGQTLTATPGTWTGSPSLSYQWYASGSPISGETGSTYNVDLADPVWGPAITVIETPSGGGVPVESNALAYLPSVDADNLLDWDPATLTPGAVASWIDEIAGVDFAQATGAKQAAASATSMNGTPGVTSGGDDSLVAAVGAIVGGKPNLAWVLSMVDASTGSSALVAMELTTSTTGTNGGAFLVVNDGGAGRVNVGVRGTTGMTERFAAETLATPRVVAAGLAFGTAGAGAVPFVRVDGVAQALTNQATASAAGTAASAALHLFGRGTTPTLAWPGTVGRIVVRQDATESDALRALEKFVAWTCGKSI